jgi:soluble cytochrome b562
MSDLSKHIDSINYQAFLDEDPNKKITIYDVKENIIDINNSTPNKDFIFLLMFETWISLQTISVYKENGAAIPKFIKETSIFNFKEFNLYPFSGNLSLLPIINITLIIDIFIKLNVNTDANFNRVKTIYENIENKLLINNTKKGPRVKKINNYINANFKTIKKADSGLYRDLIILFDKDVEKYFITPAEYKKLSTTDKAFFFGKNLIDDFLKKIEKIKNVDFTKLKTITECVSYQTKITEYANKVKQFFQIIFKMIIELNNLLDKENTQEFIGGVNLENNIPSITVDQLIENSKTTSAFKKAYVVRENNLVAYITIKILYYINNANYIEINNFDIPYNNILNLEHNIYDQKITISLIDTEGDLSELLIYKMYQITTQVNESKKINDISVEASLPYVLEVEYGWAGPQTEDDDEMLDEKIFTKKNYRGYIKSISSQFTPKGSEYTLEIMPIEYENNLSHNAYYDFFYHRSDTPISSCSFISGLFILYFVLKYSSEDMRENIGNLFRKIDYGLDFLNYGNTWEIVYNESPRFGVKKKENDKILAKIDLNVGSEELKAKKKDDVTLIKALLKDLQVTQSFFYSGRTQINYSRISSRYIADGAGAVSDINIKKLNNILTSLDSHYKLNAWLVGVYFLWKISNFFRYMDKVYLFHDTTGVFNNIIYKYNDTPVISNFYFYDKINSLNVFCFKNADEISVSDANITVFYEKVKQTIFDEKINILNQYYLQDIFLKNETDNAEKQLNVFTQKIQNIFSAIKHIGFNMEFNKDNMYQFSNGIKTDFMSYKDLNKNYINTLEREYKRKIYGMKNYIYTAEIINEKNEDKRDEKSFQNFKDNFKKEIFNINKIDTLQQEDNAADVFSNIEESKNENKKVIDIINILFLSYKIDKNKIINNNEMLLEQKVSILSKNIMQSYSLMPSIKPKTRNSNKQFFGQGNDNLFKEGTGDIIEFSLQEFDISKILSLNIQAQNSENFALNDFYNQVTLSGMYENAAKYYNTYIDIYGKPDKQKILRNMAQLKDNYNKQINVKGNITILGEPYWSNIDYINRSIFIYLNIYYNSGAISDHTGLYTIENIIQNIENNKFVTRMDILRIPTFLNDLNEVLTTKTAMFVSN